MSSLMTIAFYLPQFHPIPENDEWWGKGFTEWTNVTRARPRFPDHYQPHLPADLGFYDLRLPEIREAQADLARAAGLTGFCYYHYWFNGRRILERPFNEVLSSGTPKLPFCLCWANENWTRAWDGKNRDVLLAQEYGDSDDLEHVRALMPAFSDPRYIRVDGRPLFLVYRTELLADPGRTAAIWREEAIRAGIGDLYLARVESFTDGVDPASIGFDAAVEFAPDWRRLQDIEFRSRLAQWLIRAGLLSRYYADNNIVPYAALVQRMREKTAPAYQRFRCVTPGFDNSARRQTGAAIVTGSDPELYGLWLAEVARDAVKNHRVSERVVFVNAWNEWAEGNHLEPDQRFGRAFIEATAMALNAAQGGQDAAARAFPGVPKRSLAEKIGELARHILYRDG